MKPIQQYTNEEILLLGLHAISLNLGRNYQIVLEEMARIGLRTLQEYQQRYPSRECEQIVCTNATASHLAISQFRDRFMEVEETARQN